MPDTLSDDELLQRYRRSNDNQWLGMLLQRYTLLLLGVCLKYLKDKDAAQDAVQQTFLKAITHLPEGDIQNFKGWLYVLSRNHCLQLLRDKKWLAPEETLQHIPAEADTQQDALLLNATLEELHAAIAGLKPEQRGVIVAFYLQKKSYATIISETGYNFAQVKTYIQNGKRNLRIIISESLKKQRS